jgi:hypothetical protein
MRCAVPPPAEPAAALASLVAGLAAVAALDRVPIALVAALVVLLAAAALVGAQIVRSWRAGGLRSAPAAAVASRPLVAAPLVDLAPWLTATAERVAFGVGHDGAIHAASRASAEPGFVEQGHGRFPKSRLDDETAWTVVTWRAATGAQTVVVHERLNVSYIQPYPGGVLLVGARCTVNGGRVERNALAIDEEGRSLRRLTLGDGIADVRSRPDGTIWVAYFDEGVIGNRGWGEHGGGPEPLGASGLVAFSHAGERKRVFDAAAAGLDGVLDVYAMTTAGEDVWIYYYTGFPIVRVGPTATTAWACAHRGAHAMAVRGSRVLLVGDYQDRGRARVLELRADGTSAITDTFRLVDDRGAALGDARCVGAGDALYVLRGTEVLVVREW